jgi:hypothetical protein
LAVGFLWLLPLYGGCPFLQSQRYRGLAAGAREPREEDAPDALAYAGRTYAYDRRRKSARKRDACEIKTNRKFKKTQQMYTFAIDQ